MSHKFRLYPFAALVMLCLFTLGYPAQADNNPNPQSVTRTTWGAIKVLYRAETAAEKSPMPSAIQKPGVGQYATYSGDWSNNILSEAYYSLNRYRTGSSNCIYQGMAMSDWDYVPNDPGALTVVTNYIGSANRGGITGTWNGCCHRGGYCKFFVDLVLYWSSYGIGNGWHLVLPGGTYYYGGYMPAYDVRQAQPGWVIQRAGSNPHTAIVARNLGWGLDLIDSNYTGGNGNFVISRHALSWADLYGYTAYRATYMQQF